MAWYTRSYRRNLVDMHIERHNPEFLSRFDAEAYFECLRRAHIQSPMIYIQSHVGLCNWDSASGQVHPAFHGNNQIGKLIDLCHAEGMDVVAYYSLIYNNWAHEHYPAWRMLDVHGRHSRENGTRYGLLCPNNAEYRAFVSAQMAEFCAVYDFEGVFLDMTFWPMTCYCDACRARFRREVGGELPEVVDWSDARWLAFQAARERWLTEFANFATGGIKHLKPAASVEHQFSTIAFFWQFGVTGGIGEACDYAGGDLYGGYMQQSFICKLYQEATRNPPFEYMTSRCDPNLLDHTTTKSLESLKLHNYLTLAHHGAFLAIDAIDPRGTLNEKFYDTLGQVFAESMPYEPYLGGAMCADAAVLLSYTSKMDVHATPAAPDKASSRHAQMDAAIGAASTLQMGHVLYTALPDNRLSRLSDMKLLVLSEASFLSEDQVESIARFVEGGGALYASGWTHEPLMNRLLGIEYEGMTREKITYIAPTAQGQCFFGDMFSADYPVAFKGAQVLARVPDGARVLATVTLPYTDPADGETFASIHSNPPGVPTRRASIVMGSYGKGRVMWSAASFERNEQRAHKQIVLNLFTELRAARPLLTSDAPAHVDITMYAGDGQLLVHAVNAQELTPVIPCGAFEIAVACDEPVARVTRLPGGEPLAWRQENGYVRVSLPGLYLHEMIAIDYEGAICQTP